MDKDSQKKIQDDLCDYMPFKYYEETQKFDASIGDDGLEYNITKSFYFSCQLLNNVDADKSMKLVYMLGMNSNYNGTNKY